MPHRAASCRGAGAEKEPDECEGKITGALYLYLSLNIIEEKRPKENLKQYCFLVMVSSGGFLKKGNSSGK